MEKRNIESKVENIASNLNTKKQDNRIRRLISEIKEDLGSGNKTDPSKERKKRTLTNHELGNVELGLDSSDQENQYFDVRKSLIRDLDTKLKNAKRDLSNLSESVNSFDIDEMSATATEAKNRIFGIKDDFEYTLFRRSEPIYNQYVDLRSRRATVSKDDIEDFIESLEKVVEECSRASDMLNQFEMPDEETVREEVNQTRKKRMQREWEETKPFMAERTIKKHFSSGERFTAKDLSEKVENWSEDTALSVIEDAIESRYDLDIRKDGEYYVVE